MCLNIALTPYNDIRTKFGNLEFSFFQIFESLFWLVGFWAPGHPTAGDRTIFLQERGSDEEIDLSPSSGGVGWATGA